MNSRIYRQATSLGRSLEQEVDGYLMVNVEESLRATVRDSIMKEFDAAFAESFEADDLPEVSLTATLTNYNQDGANWTLSVSGVDIQRQDSNDAEVIHTPLDSMLIIKGKGKPVQKRKKKAQA